MFARRAIAAMLVSTLALGVYGCGSSSKEAAIQTASSNSNINASFEYNDSTVKLVKAHVHETEYEYEYKDYIALEFDLSNLSEKDKHYFEDDFFLSDVAVEEEYLTQSASYDTRITTGDRCYIVFEYPFITNRESIVGKAITIVVKEGTSDIIPPVCSVRCTVDDLDSDDEFLSFLRPLGYSHFNIHGHLMI